MYLKAIRQEEKIKRLLPYLLPAVMFTIFLIHPAYAAEAYESPVKDLLEKIVKVIAYIFQGIGLVNLVWGAGALVMAFRADNGEAQNGATMRALAGAIMLFIPYIVKSLGLFSLLGGSSLTIK